MVRSKIFTLFILLGVLSFGDCEIAQAHQHADGSVLLPGTQIVAGDPNKNEFYIVNKADAERIKVAVNREMMNTQVENINKKQKVSTIKFALNKAFHVQHTKKLKYQTASKTKQPATRLAHQRHTTRVKIALR